MTGEHVTVKQLPLNIAQEQHDEARQASTDLSFVKGFRSLEDIEKEAILATLQATNGNKEVKP